MIKKIIFTVISLIILITLILFVNKEVTVKEDCNFSVDIINDDYCDTKNLVLLSNQSLIDVLEDEYYLNISNGMVLEIDVLKDYDSTKYFIEIYVNYVKSNKGINNINVNNNDKISFVLKEIGDFSNAFD